jgi:hypothetical protein
MRTNSIAKRIDPARIRYAPSTKRSGRRPARQRKRSHATGTSASASLHRSLATRCSSRPSITCSWRQWLPRQSSPSRCRMAGAMVHRYQQDRSPRWISPFRVGRHSRVPRGFGDRSRRYAQPGQQPPLKREPHAKNRECRQHDLPPIRQLADAMCSSARRKRWSASWATG